MTLPASFPISKSQINVELGRAATDPFDIQGAEERELAGVPSGAISFSDFLGKSAFAGSWLGTFSSNGTSVTGVDFGTAAASRRMFMAVHWYGSAGSSDPVTISSASIGGVAATIHAQTGNWNSATNQVYVLAIISAVVPTGTSGTVSIVPNQGSPQKLYVSSVRTVGIPGSIHDTYADHCHGTCSSISGTIAVPANGMVIAAVIAVGSSAIDVTIDNPTPANYDANPLTAMGVAGTILFDQSVNAARAVGATGSGVNRNTAAVAITWSQV